MLNIKSYFSIMLDESIVLVRFHIIGYDGLLKLRCYTKVKHTRHIYTAIAYPCDGVYSFYLEELQCDKKYKYFLKCCKNDSKGYFYTLPKQCRRDVVFNLLSCFDCDTNSIQSDIVPCNKVAFNFILGDIVYSDHYFETNSSKLLKTRNAMSVIEYKEIYDNKLFNVQSVNKMFKNSLTLPIMNGHEIFNNFDNFHRLFKYDNIPGPNGFSELQIAGNIIYSANQINFPSFTPSSPPFPLVSQDIECVLMPNQSPNYSESVKNGLRVYKSMINPKTNYYKFKNGTDVEFFVLDIHSDLTQLNVNDNTQTLSMISAEQMNWLKNSLLDSTATIKFIVTSQPFSDTIIFPKNILPTSQLKATFTQAYDLLVANPGIYRPLISLFGIVIRANSDYENLSIEQKYRVFGPLMSSLGFAGWMYYDNTNEVKHIPQSIKQRSEIINYIETNNIFGVIFLTGNTHTSFVGYVDDLNNKNNNGFPIIEICSSPVLSPIRTTIMNYVNDVSTQRQFAYVAQSKNYLEVSTDLNNDKIIVKCIKNTGNPDIIEIDLIAYKKLQQGDGTQSPIKVNNINVM